MKKTKILIPLTDADLEIFDLEEHLVEMKKKEKDLRGLEYILDFPNLETLNRAV